MSFSRPFLCYLTVSRLPPDIGCGQGDFLNALLDEFPSVRAWGIDIGEDLIKAARAEALSLGVADRAEYTVADFTQITPALVVSKCTKVYLYIVSRQLQDPALKALLMALAEAGIPIVSYVFEIDYLDVEAVDSPMQLRRYRVGDAAK